MKRCPMSCTCYARQRSVPFLALQSKTFLWSCGKSNHNEAHITKLSKFYSHSPQKLQNQGEVILELSKTSQRGWVLDSSILRSGVCVWIIWKDVKLLSDGLAVSFLLTRFFNHELDFPIQQGAAGEHCSQRPTKTLQCSCENVPAIFQFFVNGNRLSQEPACRFSNSFQTTVRFSQSDWAASEQVNPSSKDVERFPRTVSHFQSSNHSCQV